MFQITEENVSSANKEYSGLTDIVMWSLPETLLQPLLHRLHLERIQRQNGEQITAKQFLFKSDPALRNVVAKEALQWRRGNITQVCFNLLTILCSIFFSFFLKFYRMILFGDTREKFICQIRSNRPLTRFKNFKY